MGNNITDYVQADGGESCGTEKIRLVWFAGSSSLVTLLFFLASSLIVVRDGDVFQLQLHNVCIVNYLSLQEIGDDDENLTGRKWKM